MMSVKTYHSNFCTVTCAATGLESLSLCYDEDDGPDINLEGNLHLLASIPQVSAT